MSAVETVEKWRRENATAFSAAIFLVAIAVVKTILTKKLFKHVNTPVAYSILSCVATNVCMVPLFYLKRDTREGFAYLERAMIPKFALICVAIAIDLGCTNAGLALLSLALQQCIKATSPAATMLVESFYKGTRPHPVLFVVVICICFGPVLAQMGTSSWEGSLFGIAMIMTSVVGGAFKYVFCHAAIKEHRQKMGTLAFTFWVEIFVGLMLLPWCAARGRGPRIASASPAHLPRIASASPARLYSMARPRRTGPFPTAKPTPSSSSSAPLATGSSSGAPPHSAACASTRSSHFSRPPRPPHSPCPT